MTEINLLPWREKKREREKKQFTGYLAIGLITAMVIVFLINYYTISLIDEQTTRNQVLKKEIARLDAQIKDIRSLKKLRSALIARMKIVQNLQETRILTVRLFDEIVKIMPDGVYLNQMSRVNDKVTVLGYSESNSNISKLMRNIQQSVWIQDPQLTEIKKTKDVQESNSNEFKLSFIVKPKDKGRV